MDIEKRFAEYLNVKKSVKVANKQKGLSLSGEFQTIGRPAGPKAKGHYIPAIRVFPVTRFSVIPSGNSVATVLNSARAKDLRKARNKAARAAKTSVSL